MSIDNIFGNKISFGTVHPHTHYGTAGERDERSVFVAGVEPAVAPCSEPDCEATAAVRLHVPWAADDRLVCAAHARALASRDGVVAEPLADSAEEFP